MRAIKKTEDLLLNHAEGPIKTCLKLAELEIKWACVVGNAVAERSAPVAWEFKEGDPILTINVEDANLVQAIKFRRTAIVKSLKTFLGIDSLKIEICIGKVTKPSAAKDPAPAFKRRPPIFIPENLIEKTADVINCDTDDKELAQIIAKFKILSEKNSNRR